MPIDAERHGDEARQPLLRGRTDVTSGSTTGSSHVVEGLPDAGDLQEARRPSSRPRARATGIGHRARAFAVVRVLVVGVRRVRRGLPAEDVEVEPQRVEPREERAEEAADVERPAERAARRASARRGSRPSTRSPRSGGIPTSASVPIRNVACVNGIDARRPPIFRMSCSPSRWWITMPGGEEEQRLEERVREEVEHREPVRPDPGARRTCSRSGSSSSTRSRA